MHIKNVFEYLEMAFFQIFSRDGVFALKSSFLIGIISSLITLCLFIGLFACAFIWYTSAFANVTSLICMLFFLLFIISFGFLESAFYAIVIPAKFQESLRITTVYEDLALWRKHVSSYFAYITLYSIVLLVSIVALGALGYFFYSIFSRATLFVYGIVALWIYFYILTRFTVSWYHILFGNSTGTTLDVFIQSFSILASRVLNAFLKILGFSIIVSIASGVVNYIVQLFMPNLSNLFMEIISEFQKIKDAPGLQETLEIFTGHLPEIALKGIYTILIFIAIHKISRIFQIAMKHVFLMNYYFDVVKEKESSLKG